MVNTHNETIRDFQEATEELALNEISLDDFQEDSNDLDFQSDFDFDSQPDIETVEDVTDGVHKEHVNDDKEVEELEEEWQEKLEEFVLPDELVPSISNVVNRIAPAGVMSVVNSENGKRVSIAREVINRLGQPTSIQIGFMKSKMVIGKYLGDSYTSYELRKQGAKGIIYSKDLVEQITSQYVLDFTERTSLTFTTAKYKKMNDKCIALITME